MQETPIKTVRTRREDGEKRGFFIINTPSADLAALARGGVRDVSEVLGRALRCDAR
jgi:hypothetical protein